jgi:hypothetical protein
MMGNTIILCEGQSEESFIKNIMAPYLYGENGIYVTPVILGGVSRYAQIRRELINLGRDKSSSLTTMIDYYKLPNDVPGVGTCNKMNPRDIAEYIEDELYRDLASEIHSIKFFP